MVQVLLFETTDLSIYFSTATVTFRVALVQQCCHGFSSFTKNKYAAQTNLPKRSQL